MCAVIFTTCSMPEPASRSKSRRRPKMISACAAQFSGWITAHVFIHGHMTGCKDQISYSHCVGKSVSHQPWTMEYWNSSLACQFDEVTNCRHWDRGSIDRRLSLHVIKGSFFGLSRVPRVLGLGKKNLAKTQGTASE